MATQTTAQSQSKFMRTVTKTGRWRGIKATPSEAGDKAQGKFKRLANHKSRRQPEILHLGANGVKFNDTGYGAFNAYLAPDTKGLYKREGLRVVRKRKERIKKLKVVR